MRFKDKTVNNYPNRHDELILDAYVKDEQISYLRRGKCNRRLPYVRGRVVKQPHAILHSHNVEALQMYDQAHYLYGKKNHTTKDGSSLRFRLWKRQTWLHEYSGERHTPWNKRPQSYHVGIRYLLRIHSCMFWRMKYHTSPTNLSDKLNTCNSCAMRPSGSCLDNRRLVPSEYASGHSWSSIKHNGECTCSFMS